MAFLPRCIARFALQPFNVQALLLCALTVAGSVFDAGPAQAQFFWFDGYNTPKTYRARPEAYQQRRERRRPAEAGAENKSKLNGAETAKAEAGGPPLFAVVSIGDQHVSIYGADGLIETSKVSTGTEQNPTPTGVFAIIQKSRWHESNIYSGAEMPFMQRLTWTGVAMHQGKLPGYPASHGCIRLPAAFAERWFGMTKIGLRVVIAPDDIAPQRMTHPKLPVPLYRPDPGGEVVQEPVQSASLSLVSTAALLPPAAISMLNPVEFAAAERLKARAELKDAQKGEDRAEKAVEAASQVVKQAAVELKRATRAAEAARERLSWFGLIGNRPPPPVRADFGDGLMVALANYEEANRKLGQAEIADRNARAETERSKTAVTDAEKRTAELKQLATDMGRRTETMSVLISRKDSRMYVRQALRPVFDVPVTIRNADEALGTHVFVAGAPAAGEQALRWNALTLPPDLLPQARIARQKRGSDIETGSIATAISVETAARALDRIEFPAGAMERVAELVWAGSSVIITDRGLNPDTPIGMDFIVETRH